MVFIYHKVDFASWSTIIPKYPPGNEKTYPTYPGKAGKSSTQTYLGWGYAIVPRRVIPEYNLLKESWRESPSTWPADKLADHSTFPGSSFPVAGSNKNWYTICFNHNHIQPTSTSKRVVVTGGCINQLWNTSFFAESRESVTCAIWGVSQHVAPSKEKIQLTPTHIGVYDCSFVRKQLEQCWKPCWHSIILVVL